MGARPYDQYCAVARAMEVVGERWTMLVLRELLDGPLRFADLLARVPAISTDVLTRRLRTLEEAGIVERAELAPPAARVVYQLTERGRAIEPVLLSTARFGFGLLGQPRPDDVVDVRWLTLALRALLDGRRPPRDLTVRFDTPQGSVTLLAAAEGVSPAPDRDPDVTLRADMGTLAAAIEPERAAELIASGHLVVEGDADAVRTLSGLLRTSSGAAAGVSGPDAPGAGR